MITRSNSLVGLSLSLNEKLITLRPESNCSARLHLPDICYEIVTADEGMSQNWQSLGDLGASALMSMRLIEKKFDKATLQI